MSSDFGKSLKLALDRCKVIRRVSLNFITWSITKCPTSPHMRSVFLLNQDLTAPFQRREKLPGCTARKLMTTFP